VIPRTTFSKDDEAELLSAVHETSRIKRHAATSQQQCLTDHIRLISHQRKQILLIDLSNCSAAEVGKVFRAVSEFVTTRPRGSVLILSDFTGASLDPEAVRIIKETAVFDKTYVKKSAWTGTENLPREFAEGVCGFPTRISRF
jgi:bifunctional ADP-heptose synthase (sugar kinase/adenylyltransferase)